jgi:hypothetical protein
MFLDEDYFPWGEYGDCPSFDICLCCGTEFGYDDCFLEDVKISREEWLKMGNTWFCPEYKPENWSLEEQLKNIPKQFL